MFKQLYWIVLLVAIHLYTFGVEFGEVQAAVTTVGAVPLISQMEAIKVQGRSIHGQSAKFSGMRRK